MRKLTLLMTVLMLTLAMTAEAREKRKAAAPAETPETTTEAASSSTRFGIGFATPSFLIATSTALSAQFDLNARNSIQVVFAIPGASPFQIGAAGLFKHTVSEHQGAGLHIGGGLGLGASAIESANDAKSKFMLGVVALMGVHVPAADERILFSFDGGPNFMLIGDSTDFRIGGLSGLLGASIHYFF